MTKLELKIEFKNKSYLDERYIYIIHVKDTDIQLISTNIYTRKELEDKIRNTGGIENFIQKEAIDIISKRDAKVNSFERFNNVTTSIEITKDLYNQIF